MRRPCLFAVALLTAGLVAGGPRAIGAAAGFPILRLAAGARAAALAEATTAIADAEAANPAALAPGRAVALSHGTWIAQVRHEHAATSWGLGAQGVAAVDLLVSHSGGLEHRTGPSATALGEFGVYEWTAGLAMAHDLRPDLRAGVAARYVRQSVFAESAAGGAVDLGLVYGGGPWWIGVALRNLGTMSALDRDATQLPLQGRIGAAVRRGPLLASADAHWTRDADPSLHLGAEWRPRRRLVLRAGYQTADARDLAFGLGAIAGPWRLDYAYVPFGGGLGDGHRASLLWRSGE